MERHDPWHVGAVGLPGWAWLTRVPLFIAYARRRRARQNNEQIEPVAAGFAAIRRFIAASASIPAGKRVFWRKTCA
jgi:hypothetical protein